MDMREISAKLMDYKNSDPNITYETLGAELGVSSSIACDICIGRRRFLEFKTFEAILRILERHNMKGVGSESVEG